MGVWGYGVGSDRVMCNPKLGVLFLLCFILALYMSDGVMGGGGG